VQQGALLAFLKVEKGNFLAAMCVIFSAGIISRFTARQALGNPVSGLYVLLPRAYFVDQVFANRMSSFLKSIMLGSIIIILGCWTGTLLCSPTLFGTIRGQLQQCGYVSTGGSRHNDGCKLLDKEPCYSFATLILVNLETIE
jgi:hypothetical protein